jgi:hypothetical protein
LPETVRLGQALLRVVNVAKLVVRTLHRALARRRVRGGLLVTVPGVARNRVTDASSGTCVGGFGIITCHFDALAAREFVARLTNAHSSVCFFVLAAGYASPIFRNLVGRANTGAVLPLNETVTARLVEIDQTGHARRSHEHRESELHLPQVHNFRQRHRGQST